MSRAVGSGERRELSRLRSPGHWTVDRTPPKLRITNEQQGQHDFRVTAVDRAGNRSVPQEQQGTIQQVPTVWITDQPSEHGQRAVARLSPRVRTLRIRLSRRARRQLASRRRAVLTVSVSARAADGGRARLVRRVVLTRAPR